MLSQFPLLVVVLAWISLPSPVGAALFPKKSNVKHIDAKGFRNALKEERAFIAAFVAPWCGHCQKLVPELMRAANGLHPLIPVYAIDCDDNNNKPLCAEQDVKGFPTIKLFPQGTKVPPTDFDGTRTASSIFYWASGRAPMKLTRTQTAKGVAEIVAKNPGKPKAVLMNKSNKMPLLWKVLSSKYGDDIVFVNCRDRKGKESVEMGFEAGPQSKPKVVAYGREDKEPVLYEGILKFAALSDFFDQVLEGSIDISRASQNAKQEVLNVPESERANLDDETHIGEASHSGINPHDGASIDELVKKYGTNPHAPGHLGAANPHSPGHPGAANPHAAGHPGAANLHDGANADTKTVTESTSTTSATTSSSSKTEASSSMEEYSFKAEFSTSKKEHSSAKGTESLVTSSETSAASGKGTESAAEHTKDEL